MFDASPIGLTVSDADGRFLECNAAFERFTGYFADELRGQCIAKLSDAGDADESLRLRDKLVAGKLDHFALTKRYCRDAGSGRLQATNGRSRHPERSEGSHPPSIADR